MIGVKDVRRQIKCNGLVAERDDVRMNDGLNRSSQTKYSVNFAHPQVTGVVWALKVDRAARGRQQIGRPGFDSYELSVRRDANSQQANQVQVYRKVTRMGASRHDGERSRIRAWSYTGCAPTYLDQDAVR